MLSWMLLEGEIMPIDPVEARRWAEAAARQGVASAMTRLGMIFHNALGVARDPNEAVRWWRAAADAGDADGEAMLGAALYLGQGAPCDPVQALVRLERAAAAGSALARPFLAPARAAMASSTEPGAAP
jgi:hypothetical protein